MVCAAAFTADLLSKTYAVSHVAASGIVYNHKPAELPWRVMMSLVAVGVTYVLARLARRRGIGRIWGLWIGVGLLVAGVLANGVSSYLWTGGVPDFLRPAGNEFWNVADFEIAIGLTGGIASTAVGAVFVYARERLARPVPLPPSAESASARS